MSTKIEWASAGLSKGETWNPIRARNARTGKTGWFCEKVSPACENCYAERLNMKPGTTGGTGLPYKPGHRQNGDVEVYLDKKTLLAPLKWRAPRGVFVCSMTDIFGDWVPDEWLDRIFAVMALCPQHRFLLLTKRPERMRDYIGARAGDWMIVLPEAFPPGALPITKHQVIARIGVTTPEHRALYDVEAARWPLPNVWLGVTAEDQPRADERIPELLATPAAVRFVSVEPLLGAIDFNALAEGAENLNALTGLRENPFSDIVTRRIGTKLDWIICGGESGHNARPMHPDWARSLRDQCKAAGVAFFMKQMSGKTKAERSAIPDDMQIKEFPDAR
ncbi:phage Gp37/Gp68 family protein [Candidatus Parcubacteria bacterium]|nr:MAG: phage Gp37/Gp68 family protein [Candidatus Parcubacteria bacterium]